MSELVEQALAQAQASEGTQASPNETQPVQTQSQAQSTSQQIQPAKDIYDLDKAETVKWNGQTYKREDLQKAFMFQSDYTKKQQELAKERDEFKKSSDEFSSNEKFYRNFMADAEAVRRNPALAAEFIKIYPTKFHKELQEYLDKGPSQQAEQRQESPNVEVLSKVQELEKRFHEQEVAKINQEMTGYLNELKVKYPDAAKFEEMVIGRVYEMYDKNPQNKPTKETWENAYKQVDEMLTSHIKAKYGDLVKKQTNANKLAKDVDAGGGTVGKAPAKFNRFKDVVEFAEQDVRSKQ